MSQEALQAIVGTAIIDRAFRQALLDSLEEAVAGFDLTPEELQAITSIKAESFEQFAGQLHRWIMETNGRRERPVFDSMARRLRHGFATPL
ncbi:MAG: Franean1_4349 family RiPP [Anaerolineae bacterium]